METKASKRRKPTSQFPSTLIQASTSIIPPLPHEISVEILSKLPVKSLLQLRSVSKLWLSFISSSEFVKSHLHLSANDKEGNHHKVLINLICNLKDCSLRSVLYNPITELSKMDYPMNNFNIRWCDSVNGLICLAGTEKFDRPVKINKKWPSSGVNLLIWNPSIRKSKKVPESGVMSMPICSQSFRYGFGYDELHDDYKLVVIFIMVDDNPKYKTKIKIYSLKNDSWTTIRGFHGGYLISCSAKFVKGKLYWISSLSVPEQNDCNSCNIVCFDLADETWDTVEQPNYGKGKFELMLGVLGSDLVVLCNYEGSHSDLWVMKDYGVKASWTKKFTINFPDDHGNYEYLLHSCMPFSPPFFQSYKGEILLLYRSVFMIYNPKDDSIRRAEITELKWCFTPEIFVESLVNPLLIAGQRHDNHEH